LALTVVFRPAAMPPVVVSSITAPEGTSFDPTPIALAISPDGRQIAFAARGAGGSNLWVRPLDAATPRLLQGTEDPDCPFWSPDSRSIGVFAGGHLKTIEVATGQEEVLAPAVQCLGASWGADGSIVYVPDRYSRIMRIPQTGGEPTIVGGAGPAGTKRIYSQPSLLPDRRHLLYTVNESWEGGTNSGIYVSTLDGKDERQVVPVLSNARYVDPGYLIYARDGTLRAQRFDPGRLEAHGEPIRLLEGVLYLGIYQSHLFTVSDTGLMAYMAGQGTLMRQMTWVDRKGAILETIGKPGNYFSPRLSHDGRRIAFDQSDVTTDSGDIWVFDRGRGIATRLTFDPRNESAPVWSPDDRRLLFFRNYPGHSDLLTVPSDGTGSAETLLSDGRDDLPIDWSRDGRFILYQPGRVTGLGNSDLFLYSTADKKATAWLDTPFIERQGRFSPDERWIAYVSNESGRLEVYVRGFVPPVGKWRVSRDGGSSPVWRSDGRELFFIAPGSRLMSVSISQEASFNAGAPVALFKIPGELLDLGVLAQYDVSPDGQRFLMNFNIPTPGERTISLVSGWPALLGRH
ncbi:MAG TPA: hypothetical protein VNI57_02490, partial [Candidatus Saccharimonadales bacterium]|nr:hypothetical protein [Candidatus Saccharimonadales bacterium]